MTDTKPEALRLAEWLETSPYHHDKLVAAELRRLHEEVRYNAALERVLDKQSTEILRLHEVNQELLEALKLAQTIIGFGKEWDQIDAAITKAEGE